MALNGLRDSFYDFREQWIMNQRSYCYIGKVKIGYAVPLRDGFFSRPWSWVAYGWDNTMLGIYNTLPEAKSRIFILSEKYREHPMLKSLPTDRQQRNYD